jgi:proteic killer suppression protein
VRLEFEDVRLRRLYTEIDYRIARFGPEVTKAFRMKVAVLAAAADERDLYALKSLHFEKLSGDRLGQRSIRLNEQWRLIFRIEEDPDGRLAVIIEIADYHR